MNYIPQKSKTYMEYLQKYLKLYPPSEHRNGNPFITISRESGAYGTTIAEKLADYLNSVERRQNFHWLTFDKNLVQEVMEEHALAKNLAPYFSESVITEIRDTIDGLFGVHPSKWTLVHKMSETILRLARVGYVILVGRASNIITHRLPKGIHIRLVGSFENRVKHLEEYFQISTKEAKERAIREEKSRQDYVRKYFEKDINDPLLYNFVINTDNTPIDEIVCFIGKLILNKCPLKLKHPAILERTH